MTFSMTSTPNSEGRWSSNSEVAVLAALIIVFREVFEAGLIVGIIMAVKPPAADVSAPAFTVWPVTADTAVKAIQRAFNAVG